MCGGGGGRGGVRSCINSAGMVRGSTIGHLRTTNEDDEEQNDRSCLVDAQGKPCNVGPKS